MYSSLRKLCHTATGNSHAIWDHTVLPATRQRWESRLYPQLKQVLDLATPEGCKAELTYVMWNRTGRELNLRPANRKSNALPLSHHTTRDILTCNRLMPSPFRDMIVTRKLILSSWQQQYCLFIVLFDSCFEQQFNIQRGMLQIMMTENKTKSQDATLQWLCLVDISALCWFFAVHRQLLSILQEPHKFITMALCLIH